MRVKVKELKYSGTYMGESNVSVDISSPKPIAFEIGDYIDYRGERYVLCNLPKVERVARDLSYGGAVEYDGIVFRSMAMSELENCMMLDCVKEDNGIHYTMLPNFAFYADKNLYVGDGGMGSYSAGVRQLADRIEANLDRMYGKGAWSVLVEDFVLLKESISISVSNQNVWNAMADACDKMDINFAARVYSSHGEVTRKEVVLGARIGTLGTEFRYGKGNGLLSLEQTPVSNQGLITRLAAYGNTRNIPYRYYNYLWWTEAGGKRTYKYIRLEDPAEDATLEEKVIDGVLWIRVCKPSMYVPNLMLPMFRKTGDVAYVESANVTELGVREGVKFFDESDEQTSDIYPSLTGMTTESLLKSMSLEEQGRENIHPGADFDQGNLDVLYSAEQVEFPGLIPEEQENSPTFTLVVKNMGFDPNEQIIDNETPAVEMKSGMCVGRKFNIKSVKKNTTIAAPQWVYELECEVAADDSINQYFPNRLYQINRGDEFVLTGIRMPDVYVQAAEARLETAAKAWLAENDHTQFTYSPKIDNIFMARHQEIADAMKEGKKMRITDKSLGIDESVIISQLTINEGKESIPEWEVVLSDNIEPSLAQRVVNEVNSTVLEQIGRPGGGMDGNMYDSIVKMLQGLPGQYVSKTGKDKAEGPLSLVYGMLAAVFATNGHSGGDGAMMSDGGISIVSSDRNETEISMKHFTEYLSVESKGVQTIENRLTVNNSAEGGIVYIPFSCTWNAVAISDTTLNVYVDGSQEKVFTYSMPGGVGNFNIELNLPEVSEPTTYRIEAVVSYRPYAGLIGGIVTTIGNESDKVLAKLNNGTYKMSVSLTAESLTIKRNTGIDNTTESGMRMTNEGLQTWYEGEWRDVVLELD